MTAPTVGAVSPTGRTTQGPPAIHLTANPDLTRCGLTITLDWDTRTITNPRQLCRACHHHQETP